MSKTNPNNTLLKQGLQGRPCCADALPCSGALLGPHLCVPCFGPCQTNTRGWMWPLAPAQCPLACVPPGQLPVFSHTGAIPCSALQLAGRVPVRQRVRYPSATSPSQPSLGKEITLLCSVGLTPNYEPSISVMNAKTDSKWLNDTR